MKEKIKVYGVEVEYIADENNIKIIDSYKIKDKNMMLLILWSIYSKDRYHRDRSLLEHIREWRSHNIMYHIPLKFFKEHCKDCDLSNNESKFRLFVYSILGRF